MKYTNTHTLTSAPINTPLKTFHMEVCVGFFFSLQEVGFPIRVFQSSSIYACQQTRFPAPWSSQLPCFPPSPIWGIPFLRYNASTLEASKKNRRGKTGAICSLTFNGGSWRLDTPKANRITRIITILSQDTRGVCISLSVVSFII